MRAWQYTSVRNGLHTNLKLNPTASLPKPKPSQHLIRVHYVSLNPIDYKPAEIPIIGRFLVPSPATPGIDFVGTIVTPATTSSYKKGDVVFGASGEKPTAGGALAEFTIAEEKHVTILPEGLKEEDAVGAVVAGLTAYQSITPYVKEGSKVFINGGSGGTGTFGIQIAKVLGCHVTTTCSSANIEMVRSLGADEIIDYRSSNVLEVSKDRKEQFDHMVDNIGADSTLIWKCHEVLKKEGVVVMVGGDLTFGRVMDGIKRKVTPGFLGGMQGTVKGFWPEAKKEDLMKIAEWMKDGKVKAVIDSRFEFEEAPKAIEKLRSGRAKGKIVVEVKKLEK